MSTIFSAKSARPGTGVAMIRPLVLLIFALPLWCQTGTEIVTERRAGYPPEWTGGPSPDSVPEWARFGRTRFSRWDGGPVETAKAFLSGWPGFNPPDPANIQVMTNWYDPRTIPLLREANVNLIWVTFSTGFSIETERVQRDLLRPYIEECHRYGIRVIAYHSLQNLFWEDMYEKVPESRNWVAMVDGKPMPYGAGDYTKMGRVTRYMANLSHPGWMAYLKRRIDVAVEAGVDGLFYDNCFSPYLPGVLSEIYRHAASRKKDILVMVNLHQTDFITNRVLNSISTEEGAEAGVFSVANVEKHYYWNSERETMLPVAEGLLANNIGRMRVFANLSEGWKPVHIESRRREVGFPETHIMTPARQKLVIAEAKMFGFANETFIEGAFAAGLWKKDPEALAAWRAIGDYERFFAEHAEYYAAGRSPASLAIVIDNRSDGIPLMNGLSGRNVIYDVVYEHEVTAAKLKAYAAVAVLTAPRVRTRAVTALEQYVREGGRLFAAGDAAAEDEEGKPRNSPLFFRSAGPRCTYYAKMPPVGELAAALQPFARARGVEVKAPATLLYNAVGHPSSGRLLVHLLNYGPQPVSKVSVKVDARYGAPRLLSADGLNDNARIVSSADGSRTVEVPRVGIYSLLVFESGKK